MSHQSLNNIFQSFPWGNEVLKCCVTKLYFLSIVGHRSNLFMKSVSVFTKHILDHDKNPVYKIIDKGVLWYFYRQIYSYSNIYYNFFGPGFSWPRLRVKETPEQGQGHIFIVNTTASPERKSGISRILWPLLYAAISIKGPSTDANCLPLNW